MYEIRLFGRPAVLRDGVPSAVHAPVAALSLLAYLALRPGEPVPRERLAFALWPDRDEDSARSTLRRHLHRLNAALPAAAVPWIVADGRRYVSWNSAAGVKIDAATFDAALERGDDAAANACYAGDLCEGFDDEWLDEPRERYRSRALGTFWRLAQAAREDRRYDDATAILRRLSTIEPFDEEALRALLEVRAAAGDRAGALAEYERFAAHLARELGITPMPETLARFEAIRDGAPDVRAPAPNPQPPATPAFATLPFLGRRAELQRFADCWQATACSVIFVSGVAGIGKSRFAEVAALSAERAGARILVGTTSIREARPYEAVVRALRSAKTMLPEGARIALEMVWNPAGTAGANPSEPKATLATYSSRDAVYKEIALGVAALASARPLLLVLEDLHWAGTATTALVEYLAHFECAGDFAMVVTLREDEDAGASVFALRRRLSADGLADRIALAPLEAADIAALLTDLSEEERDRRACELLRRSGGNPFFLAHVVEGDDGAEALQTALRERFERLPPASRSIANAAAVIGEAFDVERLAQLMGDSEAATLTALSALLDARLVRDAAASTESDYAFTHALLRDAAYRASDEATRRRRHGRLAGLLDVDAAADRGLSAEIARHYERAGRHEDAARRYVDAARHASATHSDEDAVAFAAAGIELTSDDTVRTRLLLEREAAYRRSARSSDALADLRQLETLAGDDDDLAWEVAMRRTLIGFFTFDLALVAASLPQLRIRATTSLRRATADELEARATGHRGRLGDALRLYERAADRWKRLGDARGALRCDLGRLPLLGFSGDHVAARALGDDVVRRARDLREDDVLLDALAHVVMTDTFEIRAAGMLERSREYLQLARRLRSRHHCVYALDVTAYWLATVYRTAEADVLLDELHALCASDREANMGFWEHSKAFVDVQAGRYADALLRADRADELLQRADRTYAAFVTSTYRLRAALERNDLAAAHRAFEQMQCRLAAVSYDLARPLARLYELKLCYAGSEWRRVLEIGRALTAQYGFDRIVNRAVLMDAATYVALAAVELGDVGGAASAADEIATRFETDVAEGLAGAPLAAYAVGAVRERQGRSDEAEAWFTRARVLLDEVCERFADSAAERNYRDLAPHRKIAGRRLAYA